jgi:hypothetical protein
LEVESKAIYGMPLVLKKENHGYVLNAMLGPCIEKGDLGQNTGQAFL